MKRICDRRRAVEQAVGEIKQRARRKFSPEAQALS